MVVLIVLCLGNDFFLLFAPDVCFIFSVKFGVLSGHSEKIAANSAYGMFS